MSPGPRFWRERGWPPSVFPGGRPSRSSSPQPHPRCAPEGKLTIPEKLHIPACDHTGSSLLPCSHSALQLCWAIAPCVALSCAHIGRSSQGLCRSLGQATFSGRGWRQGLSASQGLMYVHSPSGSPFLGSVKRHENGALSEQDPWIRLKYSFIFAPIRPLKFIQ